MVKNILKSSVGGVKPPFYSFYSLVARASGCSAKYAKLVLQGRPLGNYKGKTYIDRDTPLTRRIRVKAEELNQFVSPAQQGG